MPRGNTPPQRKGSRTCTVLNLLPDFPRQQVVVYVRAAGVQLLHERPRSQYLVGLLGMSGEVIVPKCFMHCIGFQNPMLKSFVECKILYFEVGKICCHGTSVSVDIP